MYECYPDRFINPESCVNWDRDTKYLVFSTIFSLALSLKRAEANLKTARGYKEASTDLIRQLQRLRRLDGFYKDTRKSKYYQIKHICEAILKIFKYCESELKINLVEQFIKYCKKTNNFWYEVATPLFNHEFCQIFNRERLDHKKNSDRQEFQAISRIASGLTFSQNIKLQKQVCH